MATCAAGSTSRGAKWCEAFFNLGKVLRHWRVVRRELLSYSDGEGRGLHVCLMARGTCKAIRGPADLVFLPAVPGLWPGRVTPAPSPPTPRMTDEHWCWSKSRAVTRHISAGTERQMLGWYAEWKKTKKKKSMWSVAKVILWPKPGCGKDVSGGDWEWKIPQVIIKPRYKICSLVWSTNLFTYPWVPLSTLQWQML